MLKTPEAVVILTDKEIGDWAEDHTDNGVSDIIVTFGWFPTTLYTPGNADPDGSIGEEFLEGWKCYPQHCGLYFLCHARRRC